MPVRYRPDDGTWIFVKLRDIEDIDYITLDYDVKYSDFFETERYKLVKKFANEHPLVSKPVWIRQSSGGKVHIRINLKEPISMLEHMVLRAVLKDDRARLMMDLTRLFFNGEINILFDKKYSRGKIRLASNWMELK